MTVLSGVCEGGSAETTGDLDEVKGEFSAGSGEERDASVGTAGGHRVNCWGARRGCLQPGDARGGDAEPEGEETLECRERFWIRGALRAGGEGLAQGGASPTGRKSLPK